MTGSYNGLMPKRFIIEKTGVSSVNLEEATRALVAFIEDKKFGYVCVTNSRSLYIANHDPIYCSVQNNSLLTVPDGIPLVWIAHNLGFNNVDKVSGKALMDEILKLSVRRNFTHYFFGSTPETLEKMKRNVLGQYGLIDIKGMESPPFQPIEAFDLDELAEVINTLRPTFFWCGLGAPKQELLMAKLQPLLEETICVGVGLAFEYFSGTVKRAPAWMHKTGLEGVYRIMQQPERLNYTSVKMWTSALPFLIKSYFQGRNAKA